MEEQPFDKPRLALNRIYTRRGDGGETDLAGGKRVRKDSPRIECYGAVDELNSLTGLARSSAQAEARRTPELARLEAMLLRIQHELFNLGSILATRPEDVHPRQPRVRDAEVSGLEREIDVLNQELAALNSFVLPGGSRLSAELHVCRAVCRRAERLAVALAAREAVPGEAIRYLNRLSDAFFVYSRWADLKSGAPETLWNPGG